MCLGSLIATGQTSSSQPSSASPNPPGQKPAAPAAKSASTKQMLEESKEVGPDTAVITIKGLCPAAKPKTASGSAAAKPATCETVVTRKQLETVIDTVRPNLPPAQRRTLAQRYTDLLVLANAASKAGVEKDPKVQEELRLSKLQILANSYTRQRQQKDAEVPQADIEKYYQENSAKYEQAKLLRIYIPMVPTEDGKAPDTAATKALAEKIQQRAAAGEGFDQLQKEAFATAKNKGTPPSADVGEHRRGTLSPKQEDAVFGMKAGEISAPLEEASGFYIYKVVSKGAIPLDKVHDEIKAMLGRERFRESMEKLRTSVKPTFNEAYFEAGTPPATAATPAPPAAPSPQAPAAPAASTQPATTPGTPAVPPPAPPQSK
ncbi:MAG TPA: peptidyl-prolyl cis-trans isomerase [Terriglobales bacterium]|nr:peptidyl-prolyl cis-trans isomerase [Terriglobales bacterium]